MNLQQRLERPFPVNRLRWRIGATNHDKTSAIALAYIDARDVMYRLDDAVHQRAGGADERQPRIRTFEGGNFTAWMMRLALNTGSAATHTLAMLLCARLACVLAANGFGGRMAQVKPPLRVRRAAALTPSSGRL